MILAVSRAQRAAAGPAIAHQLPVRSELPPDILGGVKVVPMKESANDVLWPPDSQ